MRKVIKMVVVAVALVSLIGLGKVFAEAAKTEGTDKTPSTEKSGNVEKGGHHGEKGGGPAGAKSRSGKQDPEKQHERLVKSEYRRLLNEKKLKEEDKRAVIAKRDENRAFMTKAREGGLTPEERQKNMIHKKELMTLMEKAIKNAGGQV